MVKRKNKYDYREIQDYYDQGNSLKKCSEKFSVSISGLMKATARGDFDTSANSKYGPKLNKLNWQKIQEDYDSGLTCRDICKKYNIVTNTLNRARKIGLIITRTLTEAQNLRIETYGPYRHTLESKAKLSKIRSEALRENAFYSNRSVYNGVTLDSSYELILAKDLDVNDIKWIRPKSLKWNDDGQIRRYLPDFYLPDYDVYLDPKNDYLITKDQRKIRLSEEYNLVKILILNKNQLSWNEIKKLI